MIGFIGIGVVAGILGGLMGVGGGLVMIPALVFLKGFSHHAAQGTSLAAMLGPVGILAVMTYYQKGFVDVKTALLMAIGVFLGGWIGGKIAVTLPEFWLKRVYAVFCLWIAIKLMWKG